MNDFTSPARKPKSRLAAILLAVFLGSFGIHKFYLGRTGWGILYLIFCWTGIPGVVALVEAVLYILKGEAGFDAKYN